MFFLNRSTVHRDPPTDRHRPAAAANLRGILFVRCPAHRNRVFPVSGSVRPPRRPSVRSSRWCSGNRVDVPRCQTARRPSICLRPRVRQQSNDAPACTACCWRWPCRRTDGRWKDGSLPCIMDRIYIATYLWCNYNLFSLLYCNYNIFSTLRGSVLTTRNK